MCLLKKAFLVHLKIFLIAFPISLIFVLGDYGSSFIYLILTFALHYYFLYYKGKKQLYYYYNLGFTEKSLLIYNFIFGFFISCVLEII